MTSLLCDLTCTQPNPCGPGAWRLDLLFWRLHPGALTVALHTKVLSLCWKSLSRNCKRACTVTVCCMHERALNSLLAVSCCLHLLEAKLPELVNPQWPRSNLPESWLRGPAVEQEHPETLKAPQPSVMCLMLAMCQLALTIKEDGDTEIWFEFDCCVSSHKNQIRTKGFALCFALLLGSTSPALLKTLRPFGRQDLGTCTRTMMLR